MLLGQHVRRNMMMENFQLNFRVDWYLFCFFIIRKCQILVERNIKEYFSFIPTMSQRWSSSDFRLIKILQNKPFLCFSSRMNSSLKCIIIQLEKRNTIWYKVMEINNSPDYIMIAPESMRRFRKLGTSYANWKDKILLSNNKT